MAWLSPEDCLLYAPSIKLTGDALLSAITIAQILAEGVNGANRPLAITSFTKIITIPRDGRVQLPIAPLLLDPEPVVQMRGSELTSRFGRFSNQDWETLPDTNYAIDAENNEIALIGLSSILRGDSVYTGFRHYQRIPTSPYPQRQVRITYSSGIDFEANTPEAINLKIALASIVAFRESPQSQGVKRLEVSDSDYKIEFASQRDYMGISPVGGGVNGSQMNEYLSIFRKYRPVEFVI